MRLLVAEDDRISLLKIVSMLEKWGYDVVTCENGLQAWESIQQEDSPNLLLLDWMMPGLDGLEICRKVRELAREPYYYILLLTSRSEKNDIIRGMDAGADDYITKPFSPHELKVRLRAGQRIVDLNRELFETRNAMKEQATHDSLTGLFNRPAILEHLTTEMDRRKRQHKNVCVGIMDIDHFKMVNDTYGHHVGDQVLQGTAKRIHSALRSYDSFGRYGGEEFLIIMTDCDCEDTTKHFERLRSCLADKAIQTSKGLVSVTSSFGVGVTQPGVNIDPETLIGIADKALYRAKSKGRNRVEVEVVGKGR